MELNKYSKRVTQDDSQPAAQAMLHAIGLTREDLKKPFVGIASTQRGSTTVFFSGLGTGVYHSFKTNYESMKINFLGLNM